MPTSGGELYKGGICMDTKKAEKQYVEIVNGPSALAIYLNFMLWEELTRGENSLDLEFELENDRKMVVSRICTLQHEDGSGSSFNITAEITLMDRFGNVRLIDTNREFYYSAKLRRGALTLEDMNKVMSTINVLEEEQMETYNPS